MTSAPRLEKLTIDLTKIPLMGSALQALLTNGPLLKKLKLTRVDFTGSSIGIFSSLANHPTLESFNLNIEMPAAEAKSTM